MEKLALSHAGATAQGSVADDDPEASVEVNFGPAGNRLAQLDLTPSAMAVDVQGAASSSVAVPLQLEL
jgi:hypothetical protein